MSDHADRLDAVLAEMQRYYNARADEYDQWWQRSGRYDHGPDHAARWRAEAGLVRDALRSLAPLGDVLELAAGTGIWTAALAELARTVHAIDGSREMLGVTRRRLASFDNVTCERADLFDWQPTRQYDLVAAGFWISHVPPARLDAHLGMIRRALRPGGGNFLIDSLHHPESRAANHDLPDPAGRVVTRTLNDGSEHRIVKVFYEPGELADAFARAGMNVKVKTSGAFFLYVAPTRDLRRSGRRPRPPIRPAPPGPPAGAGSCSGRG